MADKKDTTHVLIPHSLVIFQRPRSTVWQCRYQVDGKWQRESTKQYDLKKAKATHSTILNHNAALNRVFDEAIYRGFMYEINRHKLIAVGKKSERRPSFSIEEARALRANFDSWIQHYE